MPNQQPQNIRSIQQWAFLSHISVSQLMSTGLTHPPLGVRSVGLWVALLHTGVQLSLVPWYRLGTHPEVGLKGEQIHWESLLASTVEARRASPKHEYMSSSCLCFWLLTSYWLKQVTWQSSNVRAAHHKVSYMAKPHIGAMRTYTSHTSVMEVEGGGKCLNCNQT